ncbi:Signal transduction response regulator, receiver region domain protein, partial [Candidatus Magnetoovum chiemensis]
MSLSYEEEIKNMNILIVDDMLDNLELIQAILEDEGFVNIHLRDNVKDALSALETMNIDAVLLDVMMPNVDGLTACSEIKSSETLKDIPVIMITAKVDDETLKICFDCGANDYIRKPVNEIELIARLKNALKTKKDNDINPSLSPPLLSFSFPPPSPLLSIPFSPE